MRWLLHLKKPTKVFIIIMVLVTFLFLAVIVYLEIANNSVLDSMTHYFVGDTESEITVDEVIPYKKQEVKDDNLNEGVIEVRQEGKNGKKEIIFRVTKDKDGNEINRTFVGEKIVNEAVDEIVVIGTRVDVSANNVSSSGYNQGNRSNNRGPRSNGGGSSSQPSTSNSQPSGANNDSSQTPDEAPVSFHYCTNGPFYVKMDRPCSELPYPYGGYTTEVSSEEFYSIKPCNQTFGGSLETRGC